MFSRKSVAFFFFCSVLTHAIPWHLGSSCSPPFALAELGWNVSQDGMFWPCFPPGSCLWQPLRKCLVTGSSGEFMWVCPWNSFIRGAETCMSCSNYCLLARWRPCGGWWGPCAASLHLTRSWWFLVFIATGSLHASRTKVRIFFKPQLGIGSTFYSFHAELVPVYFHWLVRDSVST